MELKDKHVAITGKLVSMTRNKAASLLFSFGATYQSAVSAKTDILIAGQSPVYLFEIDTRSLKRKTADKLIKSGRQIEIVTEKDFLLILEQQLSQLVLNL